MQALQNNQMNSKTNCEKKKQSCTFTASCKIITLYTQQAQENLNVLPAIIWQIFFQYSVCPMVAVIMVMSFVIMCLVWITFCMRMFDTT
jgi:uncharacterized membrane protein YfbV (UPF0208 family)